jgi:glycerol uptake facilitator-like aquaporin
MSPTAARRALAEFLGTGLLVAVVVGSGIMASRLSPNDTGLQLLENSTATAFGPAAGPASTPGRPSSTSWCRSSAGSRARCWPT